MVAAVVLEVVGEGGSVDLVVIDGWDRVELVATLLSEPVEHNGNDWKSKNVKRNILIAVSNFGNFNIC